MIYPFFWLFGFVILVLVWAGAPFLLAWPISVYLSKISWSPLWAWVGIPVLWFGVFGYLFSQKTVEDKEKEEGNGVQ